MALLQRLSSKFNKAAGPFLLRNALSMRYVLGGGIVGDNPTLDALLMIPLSQKLIELEIQQDAIPPKKSAMDKYFDDTFDSLFGPTKEPPPPDALTARIRALETHLRPVLVPNEKWSDVMIWMLHSRFVKFARYQYLTARHSDGLRDTLQQYPNLRHGPQISSGSSIRFLLGMEEEKGELKSMTLPSSDNLMKVLQMKDWNRRKDRDAVGHRKAELTKDLGGIVIEIPGTSLRIPDIDPDADLSLLSIEDILELSGGHVASCGPFNVLCEECEIFQFWTKDYIERLAEYLLKQIRGTTLVLDVGSGTGLLAQLLREEFQNQRTKKVKSPHVIAIDNGSWNIRAVSDVEKMNVMDGTSLAALVKDYDQVIAVCSWMPMGVDWTAAFRKAGVKEYILIGECDDGNCGDNWETWGNEKFRDEDDTRQQPPFESDGFKRSDLTSLSTKGLSRFDSVDSANSMTVSFRKE